MARRERGAGQAPAVIIVKVVCSLRLRSHTQPDREPERSQSQSRSRSRGITTGAPHPHTVTYKPQRGEELWVHSSMWHLIVSFVTMENKKLSLTFEFFCILIWLAIRHIMMDNDGLGEMENKPDWSKLGSGKRITRVEGNLGVWQSCAGLVCNFVCPGDQIETPRGRGIYWIYSVHILFIECEIGRAIWGVRHKYSRGCVGLSLSLLSDGSLSGLLHELSLSWNRYCLCGGQKK